MSKKSINKLFIPVIIVVLLILLIVFTMTNLSKKEYVVGKDIGINQITEFYDTYYNMNFNAKYQRYYFYVKDGKYYFYHEKREKIDDYGPLEEEDITEFGTKELSQEEWQTFFDYLKDGTVIARQESITTGDKGPWYYLYWDKDKGNIQQYSFASYEKQKAFEEYCVSLKNQ